MNKLFFLLLLTFSGEIAYLQYAGTERVSAQHLSDEVLNGAQSVVRDRILSIHYSILNDKKLEKKKKFMLLGMLYDLYGYHVISTEAYKIVMHLDSSDWEPIYHCGRVAVKLGRYEEALGLYLESLERDQTLAQQSRVYYNLGMLYLRMENAEMARYVFEKAVEKNDNPFAQYELIKLRMHSDMHGDYDEQIRDLLARFPMSSDLYNLCAIINEISENQINIEMNDTRESILHQEFELDAEHDKRKVFQINIADIIQSEQQESISRNKFKTMIHDLDLIRQGESLYKKASCVTCHGNKANGITGPNLTDDFWLNGASPSVMYDIIKNGRRDMPGFSKMLTADETWAIVTYLYSVNMNAHKSTSGSSNGKGPEGAYYSLEKYMFDKGWNVP